MSFQTDLKTVGFKDMHEDQVEAFVTLIHATLSLADGYESDEVFNEALGVAEDAVTLFGGDGIEVKYEPVY